MCHFHLFTCYLKKSFIFLSNIGGNVVLVDTTAALWCWAARVDCGAHGVSGLSCLLNLQEQPQLIPIIATVWIPIMVMGIYFALVTAGSCSGCTVCITLHDSHSTSFDYRRQKRGSEADLMTVQFRRLCGVFQDIRQSLCLWLPT